MKAPHILAVIRPKWHLFSLHPLHDGELMMMGVTVGQQEGQEPLPPQPWGLKHTQSHMRACSLWERDTHGLRTAHTAFLSHKQLPKALHVTAHDTCGLEKSLFKWHL